ncbi:LOW QUALITY PROTEIN: transmembrane protein 270 [Phocoena sinus]|uniref:LOW QUALITY PROTEIN: transmembrane protein 270 n=1 Tax=Phocoena sinus TaxID=42100 RepID=UPI0013C4CCE5|nr:LOW QUALITY PROTEIN: transmembrane protein 270 [Phocoena sinus]
MESVPPVRSSLLGTLLVVVKLSALLAQNRAHLCNFLPLKTTLFNHWLSGLTQEAQGSHPPAKISACPVGRVLQAGLTLIEVPVWLVRLPRLVWAGVLGCARASGLGPGPKRLGAWEQLGLSAATWTDLLLSYLHGLMLAAGQLLLPTWRLCQKAPCCSLGRLPGKALLEKRIVLGTSAVLKRLHCGVESMAALTSWHLAYLVTWTTCLASHLLQAAFEHTAQLAQAQEAEPQKALGLLCESPLPEPLAPEAGPVLPEPGAPVE